MIETTEYKEGLFSDAVEAFSRLSLYYLKENSSNRNTVSANLKNNILADGSSTKLILAYYDRFLCGFSAYTILYPATKETGQLFLKELFVFPEYSRRGVGERLMGHLAKIAVENNCSRFDWTANKSNKAAIHFYKKIGAPVLEKKQYYRLAGEDLQKMASNFSTEFHARS